MKVVAVVPAYNEARRLADVLFNLKPKVDEIVVVDDGSIDATFKVAQQAGVVVLRHLINRGQGLALRTGTEAALKRGADVVVHFDADGQHSDNFIQDLILPLTEQRADIVFGSRFLASDKNIPALRLLTLWLGKIFNIVFLRVSKNLTDPQSGLRAMKKEVAEYLLNHLAQDRMAHASEILHHIMRSDFAWQEIPVKINYTTETLAKGQKGLDGFKIVWQFIRHKLHR